MFSKTARPGGRLAAAALAVLGGCGYAFGGGYRGAATVAVPVFENRTLRRGHEFELTSAVAKEVLARTPYRIVRSPAQADLVVRGTIEDIAQPPLAVGAADRVLLGSVQIRVKVRVEEGRTGRVVADPAPRTEFASLASDRLESVDTARAEAFDRLAQWVVSQLEEPW